MSKWQRRAQPTPVAFLQVAALVARSAPDHEGTAATTPSALRTSRTTTMRPEVLTAYSSGWRCDAGCDPSRAAGSHVVAARGLRRGGHIERPVGARGRKLARDDKVSALLQRVPRRLVGGRQQPTLGGLRARAVRAVVCVARIGRQQIPLEGCLIFGLFDAVLGYGRRRGLTPWRAASPRSSHRNRRAGRHCCCRAGRHCCRRPRYARPRRRRRRPACKDRTGRHLRGWRLRRDRSGGGLWHGCLQRGRKRVAL